MPTLLCESLCNAGRIQQYDRLVNLTMGKSTDATKELLERCLYTPHTFVEHRLILGTRTAMYRCERCGSERAYGNVVETEGE